MNEGDGREGRAAGVDGPDEILSRMSDAVFGLDTDWRFTYLNERARTVLSAAGDLDDSANLDGRHIWETIPDAVGTEFYERYQEAMATQQQVTFEARYEPLESWFEVRVYPSETGLSVYFQDVTERHHQHEELVDRERVLREIYEVASDTDLAFEDRVDDLLRIGQRVLGTDFASLSKINGDQYVFEIVRAPDDSISAGETVDLDATYCERVAATEESVVLSDVWADAPEHADRAGTTEWGVQCYLGAPVMVDDEIYGTFCFYDTQPRSEQFSGWEVTLVDLMAKWVGYELERDLTEERLRRQNERLEHFAATVSHDLRNPLSVAEGWVDLVREDGPDAEAFDRIESAHDRMRSLIADVLTLARAGEAVEDRVQQSISPIAEAAWASVATDDATLEVATDLEVVADASRLQQLFENLFRNAVEHGGPGVHVTVGALSDGFYVADDGPGIPPEVADQVLELGYSTADQGSGIGLAVVRDVVTAHDWTITITEQESGGARFEFRGLSPPA